MGRLEGKVAFITGAARGQGRSHALRLAEEGAGIIACDSCAQIPGVPYPLASSDDLRETVRLVEGTGSQVVAREADVRDLAAVEDVVEEGFKRFGRLDIVCANAGVISYGRGWEITPEQWSVVLDVVLTGTWHTVRASIPRMLEGGGGGSIILTSSTAGLKGLANLAHYTAAKHGVVGLMRTLAVELAPYGIRVNTVHPTAVDTRMIHNEPTYTLFSGATRQDVEPAFRSLNLLPVPWIEARDVSEAVLWLASDEARYITGVTLPVDAGSTAG